MSSGTAAAPPPTAAATIDTARREGGRRRRQFAVRMVVLAALTLVVATLGMTYGQVPVPAGQVWSIIFHHILHSRASASPDDEIIWAIRAPRVALGFVVGSALSLVGVAVQALVRNPIADPSILGIESGAAAAVVVAFYVALLTGTDVFPPEIAAFLGSLATLVLVFALARRRGRIASARLLLAGVAVSFALAAFTEFFSTLNPTINATQTQQQWTLGSLAAAQWSQIPIASGALVLVYVALRYYSRPLNALAMGDATSAAVGLDPDRFRVRLLVIASLARAGLGDEPRLLQPAGDQRLTDGVVDLVRAGVQQVLALEVDLRAAEVLRQPAREVQPRRATGVVGEPGRELTHEAPIAPEPRPGPVQLEQRRHQRLGDVAAAELAEVAVRVRQLWRGG